MVVDWYAILGVSDETIFGNTLLITVFVSLLGVCVMFSV